MGEKSCAHVYFVINYRNSFALLGISDGVILEGLCKYYK